MTITLSLVGYFVGCLVAFLIVFLMQVVGDGTESIFDVTRKSVVGSFLFCILSWIGVAFILVAGAILTFEESFNSNEKWLSKPLIKRKNKKDDG